MPPPKPSPKNSSGPQETRTYAGDEKTAFASFFTGKFLARDGNRAWKNLAFVLGGMLLASALIAIGLWFHNKPSNDTFADNLAGLQDSAISLRSGPWGNLEALPTYIEPPDEYLPVSLIEKSDHRWHFGGFTTDQLLDLFHTADLTSEQKAELLDVSKWQMEPQAICVAPSKDLLLSLSTNARKQIYQPLLADPESMFNLLHVSYPADRFSDYFANCGLPAETVDLIRKLSFPYGKQLIFCDLPLVLDTLETSDQKTRLLKTVLRKSTLLLRLHITPESNLNELEHYWIRAGWGLDIRPMLESLARLPHGARLDIVELLPPIPSSEIYTYPFPSTNPQDRNKDCRWTALNFFRDVPDDHFTDSKVVWQTLKNDYYPALSDPRYGDLITLSKPDGSIIHVAVYIAADIVYTKNSGNFRDPFILMTMSDMLDHFAVQIPEDQGLRVNYYRNKYY